MIKDDLDKGKGKLEVHGNLAEILADVSMVVLKAYEVVLKQDDELAKQ